ncbi:MAG TPA: hypothetical protein VHV51_17385 [Polyangiaceae bacterium]|jgi:hypothetical protein|nr:hypothetical protein [Polyangiaceae bacterium]
MFAPRFLRGFAALAWLGALSCACSSNSSGTTNESGGASNGGSSGSAAGTSGSSSTASAGSAGQSSSGGNANGGTGASAGTTNAGSAGTNGGGATGTAGSGGSGGTDPGDTPPWRPLDVTAAAGTKPLTHTVNGNSAGLDPRAKPLGKLVVDLGVTSGGYQPWLGKRGFHVLGVSFPMCGQINDWSLGRDYDGDCRLNTFDGETHGNQSMVAKADSIASKVQTGLTQLQMQFPAEDWGYFLNQDGTVRWSDVAFTGMSHGASTAAVIGTAVRLYRVVSRSGPRDNTCGIAGGVAQGNFDRATPPWDPNCMDKEIASWLDSTPLTPINRFFAFVGMQDVEYGDIMFAMERLHYPGEPVRWDMTGSNLSSTNRYYADAGHLDFLSAGNPPANTDAAMNIAFGVPADHQNPTF